MVLGEADARLQSRPVLDHLGYDGVNLGELKELLADGQRSQTLGYAAKPVRLLTVFASIRTMYYLPPNCVNLHNPAGLQGLVETVGAHRFHRDERHVVPPGRLHAQD